MARHDAETYFLHRPLYPTVLFDRVRELPVSGLLIADIGCGTGQSIRSWLTALHSMRISPGRIDALDVDPRMIARAREAAWGDTAVHWRVASGEATGLETSSVDVVSVLSAYHWFDRTRADAELLRILRPGGLLLIAEYQFPTAGALSELNDWIRRNFNLNWKFEDQKPRGSLRELVSGLLQNGTLTDQRLERLPMRMSMDADELAGLLLSQARVIAWLDRESGGSAESRQALRDEVIQGVKARMPSGSAEFDFRLTAFTARKRSAAGAEAP